jgi:hypothetical protein
MQTGLKCLARVEARRDGGHSVLCSSQAWDIYGHVMAQDHVGSRIMDPSCL